jgi:hypothetical protein
MTRRLLWPTMGADVDNDRQIAGLPNFRLFTWFFVVPGILLVLLSGWGLPAGRRRRQAVLAAA